MIKLTDQQQTKINEIADTEIAKYIEDLPKTIRDIMDKAVYALLGLSKDWGNEVRIDHCNGRRSALLEAIDKRAKAAVDEIAAEIVADGILRLREDPKVRQAIRAEVMAIFNRNFDHQTHDMTRAFVKEQVDAIHAELKLKMSVVPTTDLEDPASTSTAVGRVLAEDKIQEIMNQPVRGSRTQAGQGKVGATQPTQ